MKRAAVLSLLCAALAAGVASAATGPPTPIRSVTGRVLVNPMWVALVVPSGPVDAGKNFKVRVTVTNLGGTPLQNVAVTLVAPSSLALKGPATQQVATIAAAGGAATVQWNGCSTVTGGEVLLARAASGPFVAESTGELVQIAQAKKKKPKC